MEALQKLESVLSELLEKKAPFQLPASSRKALAGAMWWLAVLFGVLQLWAVWAFWNLGHTTNKLVDYANSLSISYGNGEIIQHLGFFYYLSLVVLLLDALLLLFAAPNLKKFKKRRGWNYLFYGLIVNAAYGLVRSFSDVGGGLGQFLMALLGSAIGAYFLFQIRSYFLGKKPEAHASASKSTK